MSDKPIDTLSRWWWPGQWLRIVWGVLVDQVWYWKNVRPQLHDRRQAWRLLTQAILGTLIVAIVLSALLLRLLAIAGVTIIWNKWLPFLMTGIGLAIVLISILSLVRRIWHINIPWIVTLGVQSGVFFGVFWSIDNSSIYPVIQSIVLSGTVGLALGIANSVISGEAWRRNEYLLGAMFVTLYMVFNMGIANGITFGILALLGLYLGGRWATRQIADPETRRRLAKLDHEPDRS